MSNSPIERVVPGAGFVALVIKGGKMQYVIPVVSGSVGERQLAALSTPPALTNPTRVPDGWSALTLTPADDITAALEAAGPEFTLTLAPGRYQQTITTPPDTTAWDILPNGPKDGVILHDFEVAKV